MNIDQAYTADLKDSIPNANQTLFFIPDFSGTHLII